ncbi:MAG TPA: hypothetical protein ENI87_11640, partial [bacterium]|nr:hypothetical protein [bacterium]
MGSLLPAKRHPLATALLVLVSLTATTIAQEFVAKARQQTAASAPDSAARLQALLAEARVLLRYDLTEATTTARQAAQLAATIGDQAARAHALATEAVAAATYIGPDEAQNKARAAIRLLPADAPLATQAYVWLAKTTVHYTIDDMEECLIALRRAVDLADEADETDLIVKSRILTIGAVGWRDDPITGAQDMLAFAQTGASPPVLLEAKVLATVTRRGGGVVADYERDLRTLLASAVRLGDRAAAGFVQSCLARLYAPEDPDRAYRLASEALATFRQWGNREHIALAQHYLAKLAMHREPPDEALERIDLAIAELDGMGMLDSTITVLETAIHIASVQGLADKARAYGEQHDMLQKQITKRHTRGYRSRFWREVNDLSKRLRATQRHHQEEVEDLDARLTNLALVSGGTIILLLVIASLLQLQSQRRVARANKELQEALQTSQALQEERAALQQNLQQIERLDSIGLLAGGFAHDFNNILVGVRGNAQLLQMDENLSAEQQQMLSQIVLASDRAAGLCRDILAYAHASPTPMMVIDLRDVLTGLIPLAQAGFGSGIEITLDTGNHPMPVEADRAQIEQVFLNLIVNAGDAIGDRGTIRISIDECHLGGRPPSGNWFGEFTGEPRDCIAVSVLDNGHGMPPETIRR